jgi:hypothetical protein
MRPRDDALRQQYKKAVEELQALKKPVNSRTLSTHLCKKYHTVRTFFNRNRDLATSIGVDIHRQHTREDYLEARKALIADGIKPTSRAIAVKLGVAHSSVCRIFKREFVAGDKTVSPTQIEYVEPDWHSTLRMTREITVRHFDPRVMRIVLNKVSPARYIELWDAGHLAFQRQKAERPDSMPTRDEMKEFL